ncbi:MAG: hypothetical protein JSW34_04860 [Candidatus Zixiibacteriota bacterium]|nr:MAG: hypothetical protein JSW34_04860 [candidate division Zixibacteria bacterium]
MRRSIVKKIILILIFLILSHQPCIGSLLPVGKIEYEFVYDRLERQEALEPDLFDFQLGPYRDNDGSFRFGPFEYLRRPAPGKLTVFSFVGEDFYSAKAQSAQGYESLRGGFSAVPMEKLFVYGNFLLDESRAEDETYTGKKWRGLAGGVEQAFACFRAGPMEITLGRFASFWGPRNSLVLASHVALDGLAYKYRWGRLVLSYRLARLDGLSPEQDSVEQFENRFLAAHRLDIHFSTRFRLGLFETIVFGGPGRQVDLVYLNPIVFFHADQLNDGVDDNTLLGFDFTFVPRGGLKLFGQLLVDDFQIEKESQSDQEPDQYGLIAGAQWAEVMPQTDLALEYSRVTNWTFNQAHPRNRFLFNGDLIGGALGNDYDLWQVTVKRWLSGDMALSLNLSGLRRGEGRVIDPWTAPWLEIEGEYSEPFPTGVVEKSRSLSLGFAGFLFDHFFLDVEGGARWVDSYRHVDGDKRTLPFVRLKVSTFLFSSISVE